MESDYDHVDIIHELVVDPSAGEVNYADARVLYDGDIPADEDNPNLVLRVERRVIHGPLSYESQFGTTPRKEYRPR